MSTITTYYAQTSAIDELVEEYGSTLEGISMGEKHFMIVAIHEFIPYLREFGSTSTTKGCMHSCLENLDPEFEMGKKIWDVLYSLCDERVLDLLGLVDALNAQLREQYRGWR